MTERHESSCSVYNMPAYPNGPCDCKFKEQNGRWPKLENLRDGWDSYGSPAPSPKAIELAKCVSRLFSDAVWITASSGGKIFIEINTATVELELEIDGDGNITGFVEPAPAIEEGVKACMLSDQ